MAWHETTWYDMTLCDMVQPIDAYGMHPFNNIRTVGDGVPNISWANAIGKLRGKPGVDTLINGGINASREAIESSSNLSRATTSHCHDGLPTVSTVFEVLLVKRILFGAGDDSPTDVVYPSASGSSFVRASLLREDPGV